MSFTSRKMTTSFFGSQMLFVTRVNKIEKDPSLRLLRTVAQPRKPQVSFGRVEARFPWWYWRSSNFVGGWVIWHREKIPRRIHNKFSIIPKENGPVKETAFLKEESFICFPNR